MKIKVISLAPGSDDDEDERKIPLTPKFKEGVEQGIAPLFRSPVIKAEFLHMNTTAIGAKNNAFEVAVSFESETDGSEVFESENGEEDEDVEGVSEDGPANDGTEISDTVALPLLEEKVKPASLITADPQMIYRRS
ncbi:hypothetical protein U1Q18_024157 [Sarracenia purpurea var. burkii]